MSDINIKISNSTKIKLLLPILEQFTRNVGEAVENNYKTEIVDSDWFVISENHEKLKWLKEHTFEVIWEDFEAYLSNEKKMFAFIEKKATGLTNTEQTVWLFFSPVTAKDFFNKQIDAPKNFKIKSLINIPRIDLLAPLTKIISDLIADQKLSPSQSLKKLVELLKLSDLYMIEENRAAFQEFYKTHIGGPLLKEVKVLKEELGMGTLDGLKKGRSRLVCVFILCWRFFRGDHQMEAEYFKKLLENEKDAVLKGLKLAENKLSA